MDTTGALTLFEAALTQQVRLAGSDPAVESAARSLLATLEPAGRELTLALAEQAATEVAAQLPGHEVDVVLRDGEPTLVVRSDATAEEPLTTEDYEARLTLRLPPTLKAVVEDLAGDTGDSVNSWVVTTLAHQANRSRRRPGRSVHGIVET
jgi:hypothetical protein